MKLPILILFILSSVALASPPELFPVYDIYELQTLGGDESFAYAVNENGEVVGEARTELGSLNAVLWRNGDAISLGKVGGSSAEARGINDYGQVVGWSCCAPQKGFLYDPLAPEPNGLVIAKELPPLVEGENAQAWGINNNSWIVGNAKNDAGSYTACLWRDGQVIDLGGLGGDYAYACEISNMGVIVGHSTADYSHATIFDANGTGNNIDLGTLGGNISVAYGVNDSNQIVGYSQDPNGKSHAFLWQDNVMTDLGIFGQAFAINNSGFIVGFVYKFNPPKAFLLDTTIDALDPNGNPEDGFILLDDLMPPDSPFNYLEIAYDISNNGQIVGRGRNKDGLGIYRGFLMVPQSIEKHILTIQVEPNNVDTVTPAVGQHQYYQGSVIRVETQPFTQCPDVFYFDRWIGDVEDANSANTTVLIDSDKTIMAVLTAGERVCGDLCHPIQQGDLNDDCYINLADFSIFCEGYLDCTHPDCD